MTITQGFNIFKKSRNHLKILGSRMMTLSKFCTEDPNILGTIVQSYPPRHLITPVLTCYWNITHSDLNHGFCTFVLKLVYVYISFYMIIFKHLEIPVSFVSSPSVVTQLCRNLLQTKQFEYQHLSVCTWFASMTEPKVANMIHLTQHTVQYLGPLNAVTNP
jgi:hypothetical protein